MKNRFLIFWESNVSKGIDNNLRFNQYSETINNYCSRTFRLVGLMMGKTKNLSVDLKLKIFVYNRAGNSNDQDLQCNLLSTDMSSLAL